MTTPPMPAPFRAFAELLRHDQGQALGRTVLFASVIGFDTVEKHKADLAAASGVRAERLQEIADTGRHALSTTSPVRPLSSTSFPRLSRGGSAGRRARASGCSPTTCSSAPPSRWHRKPWGSSPAS